MTQFRCRNPECGALFEGKTPVDDPARHDAAFGRTSYCPECYAIADPIETPRIVMPRLEAPALDELARERVDGLREEARAIVESEHNRRIRVRLSRVERRVGQVEVACNVIAWGGGVWALAAAWGTWSGRAGSTTSLLLAAAVIVAALVCREAWPARVRRRISGLRDRAKARSERRLPKLVEAELTRPPLVTLPIVDPTRPRLSYETLKAGYRSIFKD